MVTGSCELPGVRGGGPVGSPDCMTPPAAAAGPDAATGACVNGGPTILAHRTHHHHHHHYTNVLLVSATSSLHHKQLETTRSSTVPTLMPKTIPGLFQDPKCPVWGRGTPLPLVHLLHLSPFLLFNFFHWLYLFSSFVHPFPFYQNSPTPFPGRRS